MNSLERHEARYQRRKALRLEKRMQRNKEYDNFNTVFTPENLLNAFYKCRKGVQWKESVQHYESQLLLNISKTEKQLQQQTFKSKGFVFLKCFYTITDSGAVHKRPLQDNIRRQYKKIRIYAKLLEQHKIGFKDIRCSYQSWRGYMKVFNSYYIVGKMNKYYNSQLLGGF